MELDVHLSRVGDEPWGFRLVGGSDYGMPLTVVKVLPNSPASDAGLHNGDNVLRIQDEDSSGFTHDDAKAVMMKADRELVIGIVRGLYDPVLDDFEPVYEPIDQEDFDQPSHPTEVPFDVQNFDDPNFALRLPEFQDLNQSLSRSLTASPFVLSSKPYRPFSTEPIPPNDVPPLEDPIILNPSHHDDFSKHDLESLEEFLPPTRYKLPISEQYDPDGTKKKKIEKVNDDKVDMKLINIEGFKSVSLDKRETFVDEVKKEIKTQQTKECHIDEVSRESKLSSEIKLLEQVKKDGNFESIETKAANIVEESIKKAVSVAQEIKNEIDVELRASIEKTVSQSAQIVNSSENSASESKSSIQVSETVEREEIKRDTALSFAKECIDLIDKTTEDIVKQKDRKTSVDVSKQVEMFEKVSQSENISTKKVTTKKSDTFDVKSESTNLESKVADSLQKFETKTKSTTSDKSESMQQRLTSSTTETKDTKSKMSTARLLAEQRAYTIGLQTIPQIRGSLHSSYHYNLLLKTFFIHLTDVMVALSRFILTEPVLNEDKPPEQNKSRQQTKQVSNNDSTKVTSTSLSEIRSDLVSNKTESSQESQIVTDSAQVAQSTEIREKVIQESVKNKQDERLDQEVGENIEKRKLSGSKMAQLAENKSAELTDRMDAVISEFQTKTEEIKEDLSNKKITETALKATSTETKVSQEVTISNENISASEITTTCNKSKEEIKEAKRKEREAKQTYVAIVESHVYTNEDAILEDHQFSGLTSETASVQSPNESHTAIEIGFEYPKSTDTSEIKQTLKIEDQTKQQEQVSTAESKLKVKILEVLEKDHSEVVQDVVTIDTSKEAKELVKTDPKQIKTKAMTEMSAVKESVEVVTEKTDAKAVCENFAEVVIQDSIEVKDVAKSFENAKDVQTIVAKQESALEVKLKNLKIQEQSIQQESTKMEAFGTTQEIREEKKSIEQVVLNVTDKKDHETITTQTVESKSFEVESHDEAAALKITKEQVTEVSQDMEIKKETNVFLKNDIQTQDSKLYEAHVTNLEQHTFDAIDTEMQESSFTAKTVETKAQDSVVSNFVESRQYDAKQLTLDLKKDYPLQKESSQSSVPSEISTPTPSRVPPTPVTDEYMFKLDIPLPRSPGGTPYPCVPHELSPIEEPMIEDPHFVKKKLIPHIDLTIESQVFDPPLPSPPKDKVASPVYTKPGLRGGADKRQYRKEEIREIERKSSLLTSAIDETIRNIEQYRQLVASEDKTHLNNTSSETTQRTNNNLMFNGYSKLVETKLFENGDAENVEPQDLTKDAIVNGTYTSKDGFVSNGDENTTSEPNDVNEEPVKGYRPVGFNPDDIVHMTHAVAPVLPPPEEHHVYKTEKGDVIGSHQGIIDGLEEPMVDQEFAKELGKPGMTEGKIAELISGESEMLREAHVMGLSRVLKSHMHRPTDNSSVDFQKIKPIIESLKDSEVLKALNDELIKTREEKKKQEEKKWTTFLQKPSRPVPKAKFGYPGWTEELQEVQEPYKVKIVKQPKPKVAPDYKSEDFETGPLPWEERALNEPPPPPVEPEEPILIPEETPEFLEAVDPLPESEVPDLEDTGLPLPPPVEETPVPEEPEVPAEEEEPQELDIEAVVEETEKIVEEMEQNKIADQLMSNVQNMVDPNAPLDQQLKQMQAQIAALAQLPGVIQQTLELVTKQLSQITTMDSTQRTETQEESQPPAEYTEVADAEDQRDVVAEPTETQSEEINEVQTNEEQTTEITVENCKDNTVTSLTNEEMARLKEEEREMLNEQQRIEKQKKELMDQMKIELNGRQLKQRPTPRVGKPAPMFGPLTPQERPLVLPGGRKWRKPKDAYNEQFIAETLSAQAELIQGKTKGLPYESDRLPYDERINFLKYEKPPVSLDHLQHSDVYKLIHDMETTPRGLELRTPVMAEADYREKCRSMTPSAVQQQTNIP